MIRDQLSLWEDPEQIILNKEKVDISTLKSSANRKHSLDILPKETYYIYKSGGINPFKKDLGPIFPFIKNDKTGKIIKLAKSTDETPTNAPYPHVHLNRGVGLKLYIHKIVAIAFIKLDEESEKIKTSVDHLDHDIYNYLPSNLERVTPSENNRRRRKYWVRKR
jgi:hypothetical protein